MDIGKRIRDLRKTKKITLVELSQMTGVAQATLSRIETGIMKGTLDSHQQIAKSLGLTLAELYAGMDERLDRVLHHQNQEEVEKKNTTLKSGKFRCEILTQDALKKKITPLLYTLEPKTETETERFELGVEKFYYVLEGEITARIDKKDFVLKEEETIYFDASLPHHFTNTGSKKAKVFCAVSPPQL